MSGYILQQTLNGIQLGAMYALIALGYTMVYGIIKLINFAHADIFMVGVYVAFFMVAFYAGQMPQMPLPLWIWIGLAASYVITGGLFDKWKNSRKRSGLASMTPTSTAARLAVPCARAGAVVLGACVLTPLFYYGSASVFKIHWGMLLFAAVTVCVMAVCAILGLSLEKLVYRPLRRRPRISALISALGASLFIENFSSLDIMFGPHYRAFPEIIKRTGLIEFPGLGVTVPNMFFVNIGVVAVILAFLWFLVEKTLIGKQMRAVSFDARAAALMGININRVIAVTFAVGASLAGVAGVLYGANYGVLQSPFLGFFPGIKAFIAAVLGGIGSLPGAVLGAFLMGITEVFANSIDSNLGFAAAFVILIVILLVKPTGLLGKADHEKI